jgi:DEP domain-containing protein 5
VFNHATGKHKFLDGHYFYIITKDYWIPNKEPREKTSSGGNVISSFLRKAGFSESQTNLSSQTSLNEVNPAKTPIEITRRIVIDMDTSRRSTRREMALLHYDTTHNAKNRLGFY